MSWDVLHLTEIEFQKIAEVPNYLLFFYEKYVFFMIFE